MKCRSYMGTVSRIGGTRELLIALVCLVVLGAAMPGWAEGTRQQKMIAYSAVPGAYLSDHAKEVAAIYDGLFFVVGSWDEGASKNLGIGVNGEITPTDWKTQVGDNLARLREAGATESLLGVYFDQDGAWPSPETLLGDANRERMESQFRAIGQIAREMGFVGVSVDVEYPYKRYNLDHEVYSYDGYTAEDLMQAARAQGEAAASGIVEAFPEAVVAVLPGGMWMRPIGRAFQLGMLSAMAERDAIGGMHLFSERSYSLLDPLSQVALTREGELSVEALANDPKTQDYWRRRCSVAPGVWPLHMIETGGKTYPVRPWAEEMQELTDQMAILRRVAKRYIWSFSGRSIWHAWNDEVRAQYNLGTNRFEEDDKVIAMWHDLLKSETVVRDPGVERLIGAVKAYDEGKLDGAGFCDAMGTPANWLFLGPLSNPHTAPAYSAPNALLGDIDMAQPFCGRDSVVRWRPFRNNEPLGSVRVLAMFDWFKTDHASVHLVTDAEAPHAVDAVMHIGWDDGVMVWLNGEMVFDRRTYPERGKGAFFKDRYDFEESVPIRLREGSNRFAITDINQAGLWSVNFRVTDKDGWPLEGVAFTIPGCSKAK